MTTRKIFLTAAICFAAIGNVAAELPVQFRLYGGVRSFVGDDRHYQLDLANVGGGVDTIRMGNKFIEGGLGGAIGLAVETRLDNPLHVGVEGEYQFAENGGADLFLIGANLSAGYNLAFENGMYLQGKVGVGYAWSHREMGDIKLGERPHRDITVNGATISDPEFDITSHHVTVRPEASLFIPVVRNVFFTVGAGAQISVWQSDITYRFSGDGAFGNDVEETLSGDDSDSINLYLDGQRESKSDARPLGIIVNVGLAFQI